MSQHGNPPSPMTEGRARLKVDNYLNLALGSAYFAGSGRVNEGRWHFPVKWRNADARQPIMVGGISLEIATGQVIKLTSDQIQDLREAGQVQLAQKRGELARGVDGYVLRYHARIKASLWISNQIDLKVGADGGVLLPGEQSLWRFSIYYRTSARNLSPLGMIDVDAQSGQIIPLRDQQLQTIQECVRAAKRHQALAPAA